MSDPVVGHKTFANGDGSGRFRHEPLRKSEADALWAASEAARDRRAADMPTEQDAIQAMWSAYQRLQELGWRPAIYCPKDGTPFDAIEAGSTGIHECVYSGDWPTGSWDVIAEGDLWPSRPVLFRERQERQERKAK